MRKAATAARGRAEGRLSHTCARTYTRERGSIAPSSSLSLSLILSLARARSCAGAESRAVRGVRLYPAGAKGVRADHTRSVRDLVFFGFFFFFF